MLLSAIMKMKNKSKNYCVLIDDTPTRSFQFLFIKYSTIYDEMIIHSRQG